MKKFLIASCFFLGFFFQGISQSNLNEYSFVVVPEKYDFLYEKDQYELNSLTKFLFNKYGFNAFFSSKLPSTSRCDGLWAEVEGTPGFVYTKITVVLNDCDGNEIYRSQEGRSKQKQYKKAYYEAMRQAFESIAALNVHQKDMALFERKSSEAPIKKEVAVTLEKNAVKVTTTSEPTEPTEIIPSNFPNVKFSSYTYNDTSFLLRKTTEGYSLYEENSSSEDGLLLIGKIKINASKGVLTYTNGKTAEVSFDASKNMLVTNEKEVVVYKSVG